MYGRVLALEFSAAVRPRAARLLRDANLFLVCTQSHVEVIYMKRLSSYLISRDEVQYRSRDDEEIPLRGILTKIRAEQ
jgi:hypothetical protein